MVDFMEKKSLLRWIITGGSNTLGNLHLGGWTYTSHCFDLNRRVPGFWQMKYERCIRFIWQCIWLIDAAYMRHTCYIHAYMLHTCYCTCLQHMNNWPMSKCVGFYPAAHWSCKQWTTSNVFQTWFLAGLALGCKEISFCLQASGRGNWATTRIGRSSKQ